MDVAECRPISTWKPIHGDTIICSKLLSTWFGIVTNVDNVNETIEIIYAASPRVLFSMSPTEQKNRKKVMDVSVIKNSRAYSIQQVYGGKSTWYLQ